MTYDEDHLKYYKLIFLLSLLCTRAFAFILPNPDASKFLNFSIQKTLVIEEPDRLTEEQYAQTNKIPIEIVKNNYAATGDFICMGQNGQIGQANLVGRDGVVVTAAHLVYKDMDCNKVVDLNQCRFRSNSNGKNQDFRIEGVINSGLKCSHKKKLPRSIKCPLSKNLSSEQEDGTIYSKDWMVLCLDRPVEGVETYRLDPDLKPLELNNQEIVAVGKSMDFLRQGKVDWRNYADHPKHIGNCTIREIYDWGAIGADDCDGSHGSSGGALLRKDPDIGHSKDRPVFIGIRSQIGETIKESEKAARTKTMRQVKHNTTKLNSVFIPVQGELLETLRQLEKK